MSHARSPGRLYRSDTATGLCPPTRPATGSDHHGPGMESFDMYGDAITAASGCTGNQDLNGGFPGHQLAARALPGRAVSDRALAVRRASAATAGASVRGRGEVSPAGQGSANGVRVAVRVLTGSSGCSWWASEGRLSRCLGALVLDGACGSRWGERPKVSTPWRGERR
jgi:hypothetical protein